MHAKLKKEIIHSIDLPKRGMATRATVNSRIIGTFQEMGKT